jgi:fimbrial chaperone protein
MPSHPFIRSLLAMGALCLTNAAQAGNFNVSPTRIQLDKDHRSVLFTITNNSEASLRFEVTTSSWDETEEGVMELSATDDLVVFPTLLSLPPGGSRRLRVGAADAPGAQEQSYRIFVTELPAGSSEDTTGIRVLTRIGVPVFVGPSRPAARLEVDEALLHDDQLDVVVANNGSTYAMVREISAVLRDDAGEEIGHASLRGWYVLSGNRRRFALDLPEGVCAMAASVDLVVDSDRGDWTGEQELSRDACAP